MRLERLLMDVYLTVKFDDWVRSLSEAENEAGYSRNILKSPSEFVPRPQKSSAIFENILTDRNTKPFENLLTVTIVIDTLDLYFEHS